MRNTASNTIRGRGTKRSFGLLGATLALLALALPLASGCDDTTSATFRAAALDSIQSGLNSILEGLLNGAFAVAQGETDTSGTNGTSGTDTSGTNGTTGDTTADTTGTNGTTGTSGTSA